MTRKEKIELLTAIAEGKKTISSLSLPIGRIWIKDINKPNSFYCKDENLTVSCKAECPKRSKGRDIINIMIYPGTCSLDILEEEP